MSLTLIYAASLAATFVAWQFCTMIPAGLPRGITRATIVALLCSPGILVGHGIGVAPTLFALYVQPSVFTLASMLIVWVVALGVVFGVPALRNDRAEWPPSTEDVFLKAHVFKFIFLGMVATVILQGFIFADRLNAWQEGLKYGLAFAGALSNLTLCFWAGRSIRVNPWVTPAYFAAPSLLIAAPTLALMWYGAGAIGGLLGLGRQRSACWLSLGLFSILFVNAAYRVYAAAVAPAHVKIGGGVAGNAAMGAVFLVLGLAAWLFLWRQKRGKTCATDDSSK